MTERERPDSPPRTEDSERDGKKGLFGKLDLSPTQVLGTALASVTAAFLGGSLGIAGTVSGAALTSLVITVGGAVYQRSLETTKEKAANAALRRPGRRTPGQGREEATRRIPAGPAAAPGDGQATRVLRPCSPEATTDRIPLSGTDSVPSGEAPSRARRGIRWRVVAVTSGLAFLLCMVVVTGYEVLTGDSVSGDSGGTTVGRMLHPHGGGQPRERGGEELPAGSESVEPTAPETTEPTPESSAPTEPERSAENRPPTATSTPPPTTTETPEETTSTRPTEDVEGGGPSAGPSETPE
ncbi:hypothetical protein [Actinopolyspora mortivallis]|uniref:Uncharacterized protein n=1 Tax=Actinopolyspora mortivallis TaxID=33906 RepID=A0A2T0GWU2_ACTMO|nr:hypothetical protein [Actinopolyspora mortivallis]PRW63580.1 hypothetical protein CEP50_09680 [Actinopolyspora mortivallis]